MTALAKSSTKTALFGFQCVRKSKQKLLSIYWLKALLQTRKYRYNDKEREREREISRKKEPKGNHP